MMTLGNEILACLLTAAGIGGMTGWLLRHVSVAELRKHIYDLTTSLQIKDQTLHATQLELKAKCSTILIYESKLATAEALAQSRQQELAAQTQRHLTLEGELSAAAQRIAALESDQEAALQRYQESDATIAAFEHEARQANAARSTAQLALAEKEEEADRLHDRISELESQLAKLELLRPQLTEMEPAQGRVHWLEVQLSEREAQHRTALHELETQKSALESRIAELESASRKTDDRRSHVRELDAKYQQALTQHAADTGVIETQRGAIQDLQAAITERDRNLEQQESRIAALQRQLKELQTLHEELERHPEQIRAGLRLRSEQDTVVASSGDEAPDQLSLQMDQSKRQSQHRKDDLTKIRGISPVHEEALNKMGTFTYVQIARWTSADLARIAKELSTPLDRIKKNNWIAGAKKQHLAKYGERI